MVGFPHVQIGERLKSAWNGSDTAQLHMYDEVQECASLFRAYCLQHNLLDFSLQVEVFMRRLWGLPQCQQFIIDQGRHIIADNVEEDESSSTMVIPSYTRDRVSLTLYHQF